MNCISFSFFFFTISALLLWIPSCKEKPTDIIKDEPEVILDYQWTVDTLYSVPSPGFTRNTEIHDIWGASDTSVFVVGDDEYGGIYSTWKFNGKKWERLKLFTFEGGPIIQALTFNSLLGFSGSDIYAFGNHYYSNSHPPPNFLDSAMALHYDGAQWKELTIPKGRTMYSGSNYSRDNFYVGGTNGQLFHYLNGVWSVDTIKLSFFPNLSLYNVNPVYCNNNGVYLETTQYIENEGLIYYQFLFYSEKNATLIDSTTSSFLKWGCKSYWYSPSGKIFSAGTNGIYQFLINKWMLVFPLETIISISGTDDNRIFALASSGNIYFFNGKIWKVIFKLNNTYPIRGKVWNTNNGVFISIYDNLKSFIYHGFESKES